MPIKYGVCNFALPGTGVFAPQLVKELGLDGMSLEFGSYENGYPLSQRRLQDLYLEAQQEFGIEYPNIGCSDGDFTCFHARKDDPLYEVVENAGKAAVDVAEYMKIPLVFFSNFNASAVNSEEDLIATAERYQVFCDYAAEKDILIASENPMPPEKQIELVERVGRANFRLFYDSNNFTYFTELQQIEVLKVIYPYLVNQVHIKDSVKGQIANAIVGTGISDVLGSVKYLLEMGFSGWMILENLYEKKAMRQLNTNLIELAKDDVGALKALVKKAQASN